MEQFLREQLEGDVTAGAGVVDLCLDHSLLKDFHPSKFTQIEGMAWFPDLEILSISMQALQSMTGLGGLPKLKNLNLSLNEISHISGLDQLPQLQKLDLSHNALESTQGLNHHQLQELNLAHNYLSAMDLPSPLPALKTLVLSGNRRIKAVLGLPQVPELRQLYLKGCFVANWEGLKAGKKLETLSVSPGSMESMAVLREMPQLQELWIAAGRLQGAATLPNMFRLRALHISGGNGLTELNGFAGLPQLETLVLRKNRLETVPDLSNCQHLRHLDLSYNPLSKLPDLSHLTQLETVILEGSPIHPKAILELQEALPGVEFRY